MTDVHNYWGIENLNLTAPQKATLVANLQALGQRNGGLPHERMQFRPRPDGDAVIFEATFDDANLTIAQMKSWLASIFGVAVGTISHNVATPTFAARPSPTVTFIHGGQNKLRSVAFGGVDATWEQSRVEAVAYLAANAAAWE